MIANPEKTDEYLEMMVELQIQIGDQKVPRLPKHKDKMRSKINQSPLDAAVRYELLERLEGMTKREQLCHGDFNPSNIIIDPNGKAHVIDWNHATQGDPAADAARSYLLFYLSKAPEIAEKYLAMF